MPCFNDLRLFSQSLFCQEWIERPRSIKSWAWQLHINQGCRTQHMTIWWLTKLDSLLTIIGPWMVLLYPQRPVRRYIYPQTPLCLASDFHDNDVFWPIVMDLYYFCRWMRLISHTEYNWKVIIFHEWLQAFHLGYCIVRELRLVWHYLMAADGTKKLNTITHGPRYLIDWCMFTCLPA